MIWNTVTCTSICAPCHPASVHRGRDGDSLEVVVETGLQARCLGSSWYVADWSHGPAAHILPALKILLTDWEGSRILPKSMPERKLEILLMMISYISYEHLKVFDVGFILSINKWSFFLYTDKNITSLPSAVKLSTCVTAVTISSHPRSASSCCISLLMKLVLTSASLR